MSIKKVVRAWKDPKYRASLSPEEQAQVPDHPAGTTEALDDAQLEEIAGGGSGGYVCTLTTECGCPWGNS
jgi:mersacidin/lichenicidin family type 2 lantibiotic